MDIKFFASQSEFRAWLEENHANTSEIWVGFYKKDSGKGGITYPQSVDAALCFGWIDGIRKSVDAISYCNRFTPRKPKSNWSAVNTKRIGELIAQGLVHEAGLKVFNARDQEKTNLYSFERESAALDDDAIKQFKTNPKAWENFEAQAPSYKKAAIWWVISAKQEATRQKRLGELIAFSEKGERIPQFVSPSRRKNT
jgi:uncharacterized protein YdeI (YjbR/CyaY-like superfamily)